MSASPESNGPIHWRHFGPSRDWLGIPVSSSQVAAVKDVLQNEAAVVSKGKKEAEEDQAPASIYPLDIADANTSHS